MMDLGSSSCSCSPVFSESLKIGKKSGFMRENSNFGFLVFYEPVGVWMTIVTYAHASSCHNHLLDIIKGVKGVLVHAVGRPAGA